MWWLFVLGMSLGHALPVLDAPPAIYAGVGEEDPDKIPEKFECDQLDVEVKNWRKNRKDNDYAIADFVEKMGASVASWNTGVKSLEGTTAEIPADYFQPIELGVSNLKKTKDFVYASANIYDIQMQTVIASVPECIVTQAQPSSGKIKCDQIAVEFEKWRTHRQQNDWANAGFIENMGNAIVNWSSNFKPLQGTTQPIPAGYFKEVDPRLVNVTQSKDYITNSADIYDIKMQLIHEALIECLQVKQEVK